MIHSIGYHGPFDPNFKRLKPGVTSYERRDQSRKKIPKPSRRVDGVRFGYMEKPLKEFVAVRAQFAGIDVILRRELDLPPRGRRMAGKGFGPKPTHLDDAAAL